MVDDFVIDGSKKVSCQEIYKSYKNWCAQNGFSPEKYDKFRRRVMSKRKNK